MIWIVQPGGAALGAEFNFLPLMLDSPQSAQRSVLKTGPPLGIVMSGMVGLVASQLCVSVGTSPWKSAPKVIVPQALRVISPVALGRTSPLPLVQLILLPAPQALTMM